MLKTPISVDSARLLVNGQPSRRAIGTQFAIDARKPLFGDLVLVNLVFLTSSWNIIRIGPNMTLSDCVMIIALFVLGIRSGGSVRRPTRAFLFLVASVICLILGVAIAEVFSGQQPLSRVLIFLISPIAPLFLVAFSRTASCALLLSVCRSYALGCVCSAAYMATLEQHINGRYSGLSDHPNTAAFTLSLGAFAGLVGFTTSNDKSIWARGSWLLAMCISAFAALASGSRISVPAVFVVLLSLVLTTKGSRKLLALLVVGLTLVIGGTRLQSTPSLSRLIQVDTHVESSNQGRLEYALEAWNEIGSDPFIGTGLDVLRRAHSAPLGIWHAGGIFGLLAVVLVALTLIQILFALRLAPQQFKLPAGAGLLIVALFLLSQTNVTDRFIWLWLAVLATGLRDPQRVGLAEQSPPDLVHTARSH